MRRRLARLRPYISIQGRRLVAAARPRANDAVFIAGCASLVTGFALVSTFAGFIAGGAALITLSILGERGSDE